MPPDTQMELTRFSPTDAAIAELAKAYLPLTISGVDDAAGYEAVHQARMDVKGKRVEIEKTRKELKADAIAFGRKVDDAAKRLTTLLRPIESHLLQEEKAIDDEKDRIKNAARLKAEEAAKAEAAAEEAERKAAQEAEEAKLREEREKLDADRKAMEEEKARIAADQKAAQDKIDAAGQAIEVEQKRLADIEADRVHAEEMEKAKAEAAGKARVEKEERLAKAADARKAQAEAEEAARIRAEALRPDREKLSSVAAAVNEIVVPQVSAEADAARRRVQNELTEAAVQIRIIVEGMVAGSSDD